MNNFCKTTGCLNQKISKLWICSHHKNCHIQHGICVFGWPSRCELHDVSFQIHLLFPMAIFPINYRNLSWCSSMKSLFLILTENLDINTNSKQIMNMFNETLLLLCKWHRTNEPKSQDVFNFNSRLSLLSKIFKMNNIGYRMRIIYSIFLNLLRIDFKTSETLVNCWEQLLLLTDNQNSNQMMHTICLINWGESESLENILLNLLKISNTTICCFVLKYYFTIDHSRRNLNDLNNICFLLNRIDNKPQQKLKSVF